MKKPRKIVVTGASSGIGRRCCERLLAQGHTVIGIARRTDTLDNPNFVPVAIDLAAPSAAAELTAVARNHGDVDAVISNAGSGHFGSLENFSAQQICESIQLNLISQILVAHAFVDVLKRQPRSDLVFLGSEAALSGARQGSLYCAAKFGVRGFAQALREECARRNLHVGIVNPGMVRSEFFDRLDFAPGDATDNSLQVDDVAEAVLTMLNAPDNAVIDEINLSPLKKVVVKRTDS